MASSDVRQFHAANQQRQFNKKGRMKRKFFVRPYNSENDMLYDYGSVFSLKKIFCLCDLYWQVYVNAENYTFIKTILYQKATAFY